MNNDKFSEQQERERKRRLLWGEETEPMENRSPHDVSSQSATRFMQKNQLQRKQMLADIATLKLPVYDVDPSQASKKQHRSYADHFRTVKTPIFSETYVLEEPDVTFSVRPDFPDAISDFDTIPMMVLKDISSRQGESVPVMTSEISGAAGGAAIVGVGNILGSVLKFGSNYLLQIGFGATLYGLYSVGLALVQLIASVLNLGLGDAAVRYTAVYQTTKRTQALHGLIFFSSLLATATGLLGALILFLFAPDIAMMKHEPRLIPLLELMAPLVPLLCTQTVWLGSLQGLKLFSRRVTAERLIMPVVLLLMALFFFFFAPSISNIVLATVISTACGTIVSCWFLYRALGFSFRRKEMIFEIREWVSFSVFNFLTSITEVVLESIDTLLLVIYAVSNVQIGQYNAAVKISDFIAMPLFSLNTMFTPTIAELHSKGELEKLGVMYKVVNKWTMMLSLPIFFVSSLFAEPLLRLSGRSFLDAWPLLVVSAIGSIINASTGSVGYMLLMTGHQKVSFINSLLSVSLNILFGALLIPRYGAMGTALGTTFSLAILNIVRYAEVRLLLKLNPYGWDALKPLLAGCIGALLTGFCLYLCRGADPLVLLLFVPVFFVSYILCLILFKGSPEDTVIVDAFRKKFVNISKSLSLVRVRR